MTTHIEGELKISFLEGSVTKFDGETHGLSHCMKAVDFIIDQPDVSCFIEIKDPDHSKSRKENKEEFLEEFKSKKLTNKLITKYRDSFLYRQAEGKISIPVHFYVLLCAEKMDRALLLQQTDHLRKNLPIKKESPESWKNPLAESAAIFTTLEAWNAKLPNWKVERINS